MIIRKTAGATNGREEIAVNLAKVLAGQEHDTGLQANDILFVRSAGKKALARGTEAAITATTWGYLPLATMRNAYPTCRRSLPFGVKDMPENQALLPREPRLPAVAPSAAGQSSISKHRSSTVSAICEFIGTSSQASLDTSASPSSVTVPLRSPRLR